MSGMNVFSDGYDKYPIIAGRYLPEEIREEFCPENDSGKLINPKYCPAFERWLREHDMPTNQCYIVWFSW